MQDPTLSRWDDVRLLLALCRGGTLTDAARALAVDVSTASRRLTRLEQALGLALFARGPDGVLPTRAARELLPAAEAMEAAAHRLTRARQTLEREVEGTVRLSVLPGVADGFIAPVLPELARRYPRLRFELDASPRVADLTRREADLALRTIRPSGGPLVMQRVARARWVPMAAPELLLGRAPLKRLDELPWVGLGLELQGIPAARWLAARVKAPPVVVSNAFAVLVAAMKGGLGAGLVPEPFARVYGLQPVPLGRGLRRELAGLPVDDVWLVTHETLRRVPRIDAVWGALAAFFAGGRSQRRTGDLPSPVPRRSSHRRIAALLSSRGPGSVR
jgi:DNA-binding transcriptional LysR family regulator